MLSNIFLPIIEFNEDCKNDTILVKASHECLISVQF